MKNFRRLISSLISGLMLVSLCQAQTVPVCKDGTCRTIVLVPLEESVSLDASDNESLEMSSEDHFDQIILATVRVTVSGICGSGTVVGRDSNGNALVLTNAHVAGTQRGRVVNVERWNRDGTSEHGQGSIIAAGYGRGLSVDFALLRCNSEFAKGVIPIPIANRYANSQALVTNYGCPRCEWPSLQVLKLNKREGQILTWRPEAIGGRSGSSVVEHTDAGPRVIGLLTWGGNGEGLGQSAPFLLEAMKGRLPTSIESLPQGVAEVHDARAESLFIATYPIQEAASEEAPHDPIDKDTLDQITEPKEPSIGRPRPQPDKPRVPSAPRIGFFENLSRWFRDRLLVALLGIVSLTVGFVAGVWYSSSKV